MKLHELQKHLQSIYHIETPNIDPFILSTKQMQKLHPNLDVGSLRPQVMFIKNEEGIDLGVYLGDEVHQLLSDNQLEHASLSQFCVLCEELSHFMYLIFKSMHQMQMSLLDVELQGELDKTLLIKSFWPQFEDLRKKLFINVDYDASLKADEKQRYMLANQLGQKMANNLGLFDPNFELSDVIERLRVFYRCSSFRRISDVWYGKI